MTVERATAWRDNAALLDDCARLGYIPMHDETRVLDMTWGRGGWWSATPGEGDVRMDLRATDGVHLVANFRTLPFARGTFDAVVFDPPYVAMGGRKTIGTKVVDMADRYGMAEAPATPLAVQELIDAGVMEAERVLARRGHLLVKCSDYVSSGKMVPGVWRTMETAFDLDMRYVDRLIHLSGRGPQPGGRRQVHARSNCSELLVFRKR